MVRMRLFLCFPDSRSLRCDQQLVVFKASKAQEIYGNACYHQAHPQTTQKDQLRFEIEFKWSLTMSHLAGCSLAQHNFSRKQSI